MVLPSTRKRGRGRPAGGSDDLVRAILRSALDQLGRHGYAALNVDEVARAARVNKTTVYRRWPTKGELIIAAVVACREGQPRFVPTGHLRDDLLALLRAKARAVSTPRQRAISAAINTLDPSVSAALARELRRRRYTLPRDVLEAAVARGELPADADTEFLTQLLLAPIFYRTLVLREAVPDELIVQTVDTVLSGARRSVASAKRPRKRAAALVERRRV
ncbi:MAG TPA: TetR/AcrR family transcriptional regulator [Polyangia bacterium]|nr:TetR/AcrR family transcriptional regulator [Polyangia bacterium]